ncbi:bifunctional glutamate N-acetyltransferase/amino-acid acetyltransferase ArgJ [Desulfonatronovibrio hydrogenovorans]|uniref:bifunctional glutamate N-acetyltransferase/amino-acid acetyltransferase ArgJ n=1 Tax=Desulfonatronovibrio hydrogenovorans TaxID=53245 RepID=UPI00054EF218|nr:bifunctional glutamate N-acetyltransferase/amino-acid acetyltransferase ArgJ [Desulfonatronovibrio hydrogenovorans]
MSLQEELPRGFSLATARAGFKYQDRDDLALIMSTRPAVCAALFTTNRFQAAPVVVARENLESVHRVKGVLINAGQANACTGDKGMDNCRRTLEILAGLVGTDPQEILPASTGVIGDHLKMDLFEKSIPVLVQNLGLASGLDAAGAIMTTDTFPKTSRTEVRLDQGIVRFWGMTKGAGMICPNMATMLGFILTDLDIDPESWSEIVSGVVDRTFNALTIDGDTSTNDCVFALAGGESNAAISGPGDRDLVIRALERVCQDLAYQIVRDAEGGTKVLNIEVRGAKDNVQARMAAEAVGNSPLVKTAMYGRDPNWGRIVAALGRSRAEFDPGDVRVSLAGVEIFARGRPTDIDRDRVFEPLLKSPDIKISIDLGAGEGCFNLLASDLTEKYVQINAHYRT